jgi:phosphatidylinositol alpha-mannosyltransferase
MKVCMVVPYDLAEQGGVKRHAFQLAQALRDLGDDVTIMGASSIPAPDPSVHVFGGIINIPSNGSDNRLAMLTPPWRIRSWLRAQAFDVVHVHEPLCPLLAPWAVLFAGDAARVGTFHAFAEHEPRVPRLLRKTSGPLVLSRCDRAIAVSAPAAAYARYVWKRDLPIIPNGIPMDAFPATPQVVRRPDEPTRLLFIGHWRDPRKGLPVLLEAMAALHARGVPVALDVVGNGPAGQVPPAQAGVTYHGAVSTEAEVAAHLRACDVMVAPATGQESFGIVLLEAMASARAIICSDIDGFRQVVGDANALRVPAGDAAALADAIAALVADPARRAAMGAGNPGRANAFAWPTLVHQVRAVYDAAIAARRRTAEAAA